MQMTVFLLITNLKSSDVHWVVFASDKPATKQEQKKLS